jgi:small neutral amino acid transporter SnatA (MarC family)
MRAMVKPETERLSVFSGLSKVPGVVLVALLVYFLGTPIFWFAFLDLQLYSSQGKSVLGPAMGIILMVFGVGLMLVSLLSILTTRRVRRKAVSG